MAKSFLQSPYYDDYDENKKFYKILFRPSIPVQARELTQIQSMLQKQVERLGKHFFKEGDKVVDGQLFVDLKVKYLKLTSTDDVTSYVGKTLIGETSGAKALIVAASNYENDDNPSTLYVKFLASGESTNTQEFSAGESISLTQDNITLTYKIQSGDDAIGESSVAQVNRGVYFIYGNFVLVDEQTILLDKYSNMPTYKIGFEITESIVTPEKDSSLYDNAIGSYNEAAPGAHRYFIECTLAKKSITSDSSNDFIELAKVVNGEIVKITETNEEKEITEDVLARRTFDESGDYVVRQFKTDIREHRSNDRGTWTASTEYLKGDIVKYNSLMYKAIRNIKSTDPYYPGDTSGRWEVATNPVINDGVYGAYGRVTDIEIIKSSTFETTPIVSIHDTNNNVAEAVACLDENGKLVKIKLISSDSKFTKNSEITVEVGGYKDIAKAIVNYGDSDKFALTLNSGKAYVKGYEIEKVGTTVLGIDKARTTETSNNSFVSHTNGNYVLVTGLTAVPNFNPFTTYNLYSQLVEFSTYPSMSITPTETIGTCKIRGISLYQSSTYPKDNIYKLYLSDVSVTNFDRKVKSIGLASGSVNSFYASILPIYTQLSGTVTSTTNVLTGVGSNFLTEVIVGDYIKTNDTIARVVSITSQNQITVDRNITSSGNTIYRLSTTIVDPQGYSSVYKLSNNVISDVSTIDFCVTTYLTSTTIGTHGNYKTVKFECPFDNGVFTSTGELTNYILTGNVSGVVEIKGMKDSSLSDEIYLLIDNSLTDTSFKCVATIRISGEGSKIKQTKTLTTTSTEVATNLSSISLDICDVKEIVSILMYDGSDYTIDVKDRYDFDNGQRDCYYNVAKLTLKSSYSVPANKVKITFKYFSHGTNKVGFFINSYEDYIKDEIPSYNGTSLRNCIDFRQLYNSSTALMLKDGEEIEVSYSYYLPRRDRICLDSKGNFIDIKGMPSLNPQLPEIPSMSMNLYNLTIYPYVFDTTTDVSIDVVDNKRYTMRDIGKLETRIKNLEDYTTLSLLEQQTTSMSITDSEGLDRFKQGFVVDNFKSTDVVSQTDNLVNCSIDTNDGVLRPSYISRSIGMREYYGTADSQYSRSNANYMAYGKVFTLPLDTEEPHVVLVSQPIATRTENINPFAVVRFLGSLSVNPSSDDWYETEYIDDAITPVEGNYQSVYDSTNGVIVWDQWEQSWTGVINTLSYKDSSTTKYSGTTGRIENGSNDYRYDYYTTTTTRTSQLAQDIGYSRTGLLSTVQLQTDYEEVGDYLVSTTDIPYMRSRNLLVKAKGLKPNTKFYPFFDNVDVSNWCTPATIIQYTPQNSFVFDSTSLSEKVEDGRVIETITNSLWSEPTDKTCLDIGDVITGNTTGSTAVVVGKSVDTSDTINGNKYYLYVVNIKGEFGSTETFRGSISNAIGKIISITGNGDDQNKHHGDNIITNRNGEAQFIFWIPDANRIDISQLVSSNGYIKFKCGDRIVTLNDNENNDNTVSNSRGEATYSATGIINTRQKSVNAVRNAKIVTESVSESKTVTNTWSSTSVIGSKTTSQYVYLDPLAQTFSVDCEGGCFISKVDVYFSSKDDSIPVTMEIRTVNNGYPSNEVLAFGECTLNPEDVNLSSTNVTYLDSDGLSVSCPSFDTPTTFTFDSPVYVENGQEYAIVLKTDSTNYRVWIAQIGETVPGQDYLVSNQPYLGVLFKSQNASTWSAEQNQDLMFTIYRANFQKGVSADIAFESNEVPTISLSSNPFQTTEDSNVVTVWHQNHGLEVDDYVSFENSDPNNIDVGNVMTGTISVTLNDKSVVGVGTKFDVEVKEGDALYIYSDNNSMEFVGIVDAITDSTNLTLVNNPSLTKSVTGATSYREISINGIKPSDIFGTKFTVSNVNINNYQITLPTGVNASVTGYGGGNYIKATQNYKFDLLRPNITSQTFTDAQISYSLMDKDSNEVALIVNDNNELTSPMTILSDDNLESKSESEKDKNKLIVHCKFTTDNQALSPVIDSDRVSSVLVSNLIDNPGTLGGQLPISNYITKEINLSNTANYLRIAFELMASSDDNSLLAKNKVKVYYKTYLRSSNTIDSVEWTLLECDGDINSSTDYQDVSYSTGDLTSFDTFAVKIVMLGTNTSNVPKIKNLRMVACL